MSKQNNLKDYLTDLYAGIVTKKPDASRNPQNFRAEIESIQVGSNSTLTTATFDANGTYPASAYGADGFSSVTVKVAQPPVWDGYYTKTDAAGEIIPTEGLAYKLSSDGKSYLCDGIGTATDKDIVIASTYNGLPVLRCDDGAFYNNKSITGVTLGSNMTQVGMQAFSGCSNLKRAIIPGSVTFISRDAFHNCVSLSNVTLSEGVNTIYTYAFAGCKMLTQITIPNSVITVGLFAFENCTSLTDVYYVGTEAEWKNRVSIDTGNDPLKNATIHYNA